MKFPDYPLWVYAGFGVWLSVSFLYQYAFGNHIPVYEIVLGIVLVPVLLWIGLKRWRNSVANEQSTAQCSSRN